MPWFGIVNLNTVPVACMLICIRGFPRILLASRTLRFHRPHLPLAMLLIVNIAAGVYLANMVAWHTRGWLCGELLQ